MRKPHRRRDPCRYRQTRRVRARRRAHRFTAPTSQVRGRGNHQSDYHGRERRERCYLPVNTKWRWKGMHDKSLRRCCVSASTPRDRPFRASVKRIRGCVREARETRAWACKRPATGIVAGLKWCRSHWRVFVSYRLLDRSERRSNGVSRGGAFILPRCGSPSGNGAAHTGWSAVGPAEPLGEGKTPLDEPLCHANHLPSSMPVWELADVFVCRPLSAEFKPGCSLRSLRRGLPSSAGGIVVALTDAYGRLAPSSSLSVPSSVVLSRLGGGL